MRIRTWWRKRDQGEKWTVTVSVPKILPEGSLAGHHQHPGGHLTGEEPVDEETREASADDTGEDRLTRPKASSGDKGFGEKMILRRRSSQTSGKGLPLQRLTIALVNQGLKCVGRGRTG